MRLEGKVVLVTASTRGIGNACVRRCAEEGAVVYMGARNMEAAAAKAAEMNAEGLNVKAVYNNATELETYKTMVDEIVANEGHIDAVVNNFGTTNRQKDLTIEKIDFDYYKDTVNINLASVILTSQAAIPYMKENGGGSIVNISSVAALTPDVTSLAYGTSKAAIAHITKMTAVQMARDNIRCNAVCPGMTATDAAIDNLTDEYRDFFLKHTPIRRMATPAEIAAAVAYFVSDDSAFCTGNILAVTGGFGLATPIFGDTFEKPE